MLNFEQTFKKLYNNYNNKIIFFLIQIMISNKTNKNIKLLILIRCIQRWDEDVFAKSINKK